jgi:arylsulfatase A-like enzyme
MRDRLLASAVAVLTINSAQCAAPAQREAKDTPVSAAPVASPSTTSSATGSAALKPKATKPKVIVFVWDGLRPDSITQQNTPNLARLRDQDGVNFSNHHAVYPTFTMMNAAAFATGAYPGKHGFYGNTQYQPGPNGNGADGTPVDFSQPVFTEDDGVLSALDSYDRSRGGRGLFAVGTLFQAAHEAGLRTAAVGKVGPAFLQDFRPAEKQSVIVDENVALPFDFARALQASGFPLPANTVHYPYPAGQVLSLAPDNGKPSAASSEKIVRLKDGVTPDPRSALGSPHSAANDYLMRVYLDYVLPKLDPDLSFVWLRNPDSTEHQFGPGSPNYLDALRDQDALLGQLEAKLSALGLRETTDLFVVSDHGHSTVGGDPTIFPLRALHGEADGHGEVGAPEPDGYPVSGEIRSADVLKRAGFAHIYDGGGCVLDPVLSGIRADGTLVYPLRADAAGACKTKPSKGTPGKTKAPLAQYSMPSFRVPQSLPEDAIVIAPNGGSEYFYVPSHSASTIRALVLALQERVAFGAIFVRSVYGAVPGTLPLSAIHAEGEQSSPPTPDLIVSFAWDDAAIAGESASVPGSEYASAQRYRGIHGSFSPRDVHNTLLASGPHFKAGFTDLLPTGNVDVAPTVAALFNLQLDGADGRVLHESFSAGTDDYRVETAEQSSDSVRLPKTCQPDDLGCTRPLGPATYDVTLHEQVLSVLGSNAHYTYFDRAEVTRHAP